MAQQPPQQNAAQQEYDWARRGNVHKAVIAAKGVRGKAKAYVRASWEQKTRSPYTDETTSMARIMRLMGKDKTATILDRLFLSPEAIKRQEKKEQQQEHQTSGGAGLSNRALKIIFGSLKTIRKDVYAIRSSVDDMVSTLDSSKSTIDGMADDINDIKTLIKPKKLLVRGRPFDDAWGRTNDRDTGKIQFAHYNPLAPAGSQFVESKRHRPKGWGKGMYTHGGPTSTPIKEGFVESAIKQAAMQAAILTLKMEKKDRKKEELRKKNEYKDPKEGDQHRHGDPILGFFLKIDKRFDRLEELIEKNGGSGLAETIVAAEVGVAAGTGVVAAGAALAAGAVPILIGGSLLAFMYMFTKWAENADINNPGNNPIALLGYFGKQGADWYNDKFGNTKKWAEAHAELREKEKAGTAPVRGTGVAAPKPSSLADSIKVMERNRDLEPNQEKKAAIQKSIDAMNAIVAKQAGLSPPPSTPTVESTGTRTGRKGTHGVAGGRTVYQPPPRGIPSEGNTGTLKSNKDAIADLMDTIATGEGTSDKAAQEHGFASGYDVTLGYGAYNKPTKKPLSSMTLKEVRELQKEILNNPKNTLNSSAVGKYQIVGNTLFGNKKDKNYPHAGLVGQLGLKDTDIFSPAVQDQMAQQLLKGRGLEKFQKGEWDATQFQHSISGEWDSIVDPKTGRTGSGGHGKTTASTLAPALNNLGGTLDGDSRTLMASSNVPSATTTTITPVVVNNKTNNTMAQRAAPSASAITQDPSLVRVASRDVQHPLSIG